MKKIAKIPIEYIIMISAFIITIFMINLYITFPRDWKKEYTGILYDLHDKNLHKKVTITLEGKYKRSPLNGEDTFIGDILINGSSLFHQENNKQESFRVEGGYLDSRFLGKYFDDTTNKYLYVFLMAYIDDRNKLVMRLYERVNSKEITFSNKIIVAPASNQREAKKINDLFTVGEPKYIKH